MTLDELDKKAGELFKLFDASLSSDDPRFANDKKLLRAGLMIAIELVADIKRMNSNIEAINKGICELVDIKATEYQNGIIVKIANKLEIENIEAEENIAEAIKGFSLEEAEHQEAYKQASKGSEETEADDGARYRDNGVD